MSKKTSSKIGVVVFVVTFALQVGLSTLAISDAISLVTPMLGVDILKYSGLYNTVGIFVILFQGFVSIILGIWSGIMSYIVISFFSDGK